MIPLIEEKLSNFTARTMESPQDISAGVLIPIFEKDGETFIILTKRTENVKSHKGEVSFPGGMFEARDCCKLNTALRECSEEIGLNTVDVKVVGKLDDMTTLTGFVISPYVGIVPYPYNFTMNPCEVAYIIQLPLKFLMNASPAIEMHEYGGRVEEIPSFHYNGDRIWGATCRMLLQLRKILKS